MPLPVPPTAQALRAEAAATPRRVLPGGLGLGTRFQVLPFRGTLKIEYSTLRHNPSGQFQNAPGIFDSVNGHDVPPVVIHSTIS